MLNHDAVMLPLGEVKLAEGEIRFIRPATDTKEFAGRVFDSAELTDWQEKLRRLGDDAGTLSLATLVVTSKPKQIFREYRCWIVEGRVVTASLYRMGSRVVYDDQVEEHVFETARKMVDIWNVAPSLCLDLAEREDGLKVLEIGTVNACGLYAANVPKLVQALEDVDWDKYRAASPTGDVFRA